MPFITEYQQKYSKLAQLSRVLDRAKSVGKCTPLELKYLHQIDDINFKVQSSESYEGALEGFTPLHVACYYRHIEVFDALLKRGADFTVKGKDGATALHLAFYNMFQKLNTDFATVVTSSDILKNEFINSLLTAHVDFDNSENPRCAGGLSHFHIACAYNHLRAIEFFIDNGVSVNESVNVDSSMFPGYTPLHFAARFCGLSTVKLLLERGADVRVKNTEGLTALHVAIERNEILQDLRRVLTSVDGYLQENRKIIHLFIKDTSAMDVDNSIGFRKWHAVCTLSDSALAKSLLQDADVNCVINVDSFIWPGSTPLHFATKFNINTAALLLKKGADIEAKDDFGVIPLEICMDQYHYHLIEDIYVILSAIKTFKDIWFSDNKTKLSDFINSMRNRRTLTEFFEKAPKHIFLPSNCPLWPGYGLSNLLVHFTKIFGFKIVEKHLNYDSNVVIRDAHGRTHLHLAFYQSNNHIVDHVFQHQIGIAEAIDNDGLSYLHIACGRENKSIVQTLLSQGANANITYKGKTFTSCSSIVDCGSTPLHIAVKRRNVEIIRMLLKYGANANAIDFDGTTPIHCLLVQFSSTFGSNDVKIVKEIGDLLFSSCDLKDVVATKIGLSHLHVASLTSNEYVVEYLVKLGADTNTIILSNNRASSTRFDLNRFPGYTPLHFAVGNKDMKLIELLLEHGADILYKKPNHMTLLYDVLTGFTFKNTNIDISITRALTSILANDATLRKRLEDDSGMTLLHLVCYLRDADQIQNLLTELRADINAQMHVNSPIWSKATPLHLLLQSRHAIDDLNKAVYLLLECGADTMMMDGICETPVHKAWTYWDESIIYVAEDALLCLLLRYHKDFSINPINGKGITHFHLACLVGEYTIVEKFLAKGVDVNLPIDHRCGQMIFQTPLLFMMKSRVHNEKRLKTIDILLQYGADVNVQDENGLTPILHALHLESSRELYFEKLYKAGADINYINVKGESALEMLFDLHPAITNEELQFFFSRCNLFNTYNLENGVGIISMILCNKHRSIHDRKFILQATMENPSLLTVDQMGRTPIHNMVANYVTAISAIEYAYYAERFIKMGFNIDAQDSEGKTALHLAAYFSNEEALSGLLIAGADINIVDNSNRTVYVVVLEFSLRYFKNVSIPIDVNTRLKNRIERHIIAMLLCGLEVNSYDFELIYPKRSKERHRFYCEEMLKELEMTKLVTIGSSSLTLKAFLSETGAIASRPSMVSEADRDAIEQFFEFIDNKQFPKMHCVLKLQYRKMLKRLQLIEEVTHSMKKLLGHVEGFSMPELCCRMIIRFLTNTEVKNVIMSARKIT